MKQRADITTDPGRRVARPARGRAALLVLLFVAGLAFGGLVATGEDRAHALHGTFANDILYFGYGPGSGQHSPTCNQWAPRDVWVSNNIRNFRFGGGLLMCETQMSGIVRWLGIVQLGNGWPNMTVQSWGTIRHWDHSNLVAVSRCRFTRTQAPEWNFACMYHRH